MTQDKLRIGVLGAGAWADPAHIPGWNRDSRCDVAVVCDVDAARAESITAKHGIGDWSDDWQSVVSRSDIDVIDIVTPSHTHLELASAAIEAGKHVLCEKPVAFDFIETRRLADEARRKSLKTKLGFTFRHSPGARYAKSLIDQGFIGRPFIFNGFEQNSQWLDPNVPLRQVQPQKDQSVIQTASLLEYGAPIIDIGHWWVGADYARVVGMMRNFISHRPIRGSDEMLRMNIDDGDMFMGEHTNDVMSSIQTSFVTVGNYPGIEARIYGEKGAIICRMVEEFGVAETVKIAMPDSVEFEQVEIPQRFYPIQGHPNESWRSLFYANLVKDFIDEIISGSETNQGNFEDGAWVQEVINAVEFSVEQKAWVDLPLTRR
jgi:predicted dehydrogenase